MKSEKERQMKRTMLKALGVTAALCIGTVAVPAAAQHSMGHGSGQMDHKKMGDAAMSATDSYDGEVRRVDKAAGKVTLRHGEIKQHDMPPMTMVFEVSEKAMLEGVKPGDKVKFKLVNEGGKMIVSELKQAAP
jgi:Cu(I)/Ag(I) efflux system periplasmic protein CusF